MMNEHNLTLQLVSNGRLDEKRMDKLSRSLLKEIKRLDVTSAQLQKAGKLPQGAKAGDPITIGGIVVTAISAGLPNLIAFIQSWVQRGSDKHIKLKVGDMELEFTPAKQLTTQEILELVTALQ